MSSSRFRSCSRWSCCYRAETHGPAPRLSFGVLTKISPIFIGPAALAFIVVTSTPDIRTRIRRSAAFLAGGAIATAVLLIPVMLSGQLRAAMNASLSRVGTGSVVGGVSVFGLKNLRFLSWITDAVNNHRALVGLGTSALQFGAACAAALWVVRGRRVDPAFRLVASTTLVLVWVVLASPLSNPQYLLWLLPGLVLLASVWAVGTWQTAMICTSAAMYDLALLGPLAFVVPAAVALGVPNVTTGRDRSCCGKTSTLRRGRRRDEEASSCSARFSSWGRSSALRWRWCAIVDRRRR